MLSLLSGVTAPALNRAAQAVNPITIAQAAYNRVHSWYVTRKYGRFVGGAMLLLGGLSYQQIIVGVTTLVKILKVLRGSHSTSTIQLGSAASPQNGMLVAVKPGSPREYRLYVAVACFISLFVSKVRTYTIPLVGWKTPEVRPRRWGLLVLAGLLTERFGRILLSRRRSPIGAEITTPFIASTLQSGSMSSSQQRQVFVDSPIVRSGITQNHTHGKSARDRNAGSATAALIAHSLGLEPYYVQMSLSDVRKGREGDRSFHWAKDLAVPPVEFHFDSTKQAAVLVDVDYYIDMPTLLARHPGTYFIAAFQPTACACGVGEYTFRFEPSGKVHYCVSGGAEYDHEIWNYKGDTLIVEDVGILKKTVVAYHIDRKFIDDHHVLVMLTQIGRFEMSAWLPTSLVIEGPRLDRLRPVFGDFVVLDVVTPDGLKRSISQAGSHLAVTLPVELINAVRHVQTAAKVPITPAMVASNIAPSDPLGLPTERLPPGHAALLAGYLRAGFVDEGPRVYPVTESLVPIWFAKHDYDAPIPLKGFGSPLIGPCYGYASCLSSDDRCIVGRVEQFHSKGEDLEMEQPVPPTLAGYMVEFAEFLIPFPHLGVPVDHDEVYDRQDRPSQRALLDEAGVTGPHVKKVVKAFVKKEAAVKPSDPRNISQMPEKLAYSCYMYAFHDEVMTKQQWYAFAKTPAECAQRVCDILAAEAHSAMADGSRFDGHVKRLARILERIVMLRYFHASYHADLVEKMDAQIALPGVTTEGRRYLSGYGRGSGSLETSDFNSILSAFIGYCGWRNTTVNGVKLTPAQAWAKLGIYGGDDSLEGAIDPAALKKSADMMGQDYEIEVVRRGESGVNFLNRWFGPDVWTGDVSSMANPSRLLSKLWVGPATLPNPLERFAERASGYYRMDRNSPVIGPIVCAAHELLGERVDGLLMPWDGKHSLESNWPNEDSGWMIDTFLKSIPDFHWARFEEWMANIYRTRAPGLLLEAPLCTAANVETPTVKQACVVGDVLLTPTPKPSVDAPVAKDKEELDGVVVLVDGIGPIEKGPAPMSEEEIRIFLEKSDIEVCRFIDDCTHQDITSVLNRCAVEEAFMNQRRKFPTEPAPALIEVSVPKVVEDAARLVPMVGEKGKREQKRAATSARKSAEKSAVTSGDQIDPRDWTLPKRRSNETAAAFSARLKEFATKQAKVMKRLGLAPRK